MNVKARRKCYEWERRKDIKDRQKKRTGHILRGEELMEVMDGRYEGRRARRRKRKSMLDGLKTRRSYQEMKGRAQIEDSAD